MSFIIAADSNCDLSASFVAEHCIHLFHILINLNGVEIADDLGVSYSHQDFYTQLRKGIIPTTAQVNLFTFKQQFEIWAQQNIPVLYLAFSSSLSGTYNSAVLARNEVLESYPDAQIIIIDTLAASSGCGLLIHHAIQMRTQGSSIEVVSSFIEDLKHHLVHIFTVDDLNHLYHGGRLSASAAFVGSLLQIKPLLYVDNEGHLKPYQKFRGRKKALRGLVEHFKDLCTDYTQPIMISHGDCLEDAEYVADLLRKELAIKDISIHYIGPSIGSHSGPNTVALFFVGVQKTPRL